MMIGIDTNTNLVYEGQSNYGYGLWPAPVLSLATLIDRDFDVGRIPVSSDLFNADMVFREDSFDPVTRIRRGRLYKTPGTRPQTWQVFLHAAVQGPGPRVALPLHGFDSSLLAAERGKFSNALIALGSADAYTLWRVIGVERIVTGEDLLTLRARSSLGTLPELMESKVPADQLAKVKETLEKLAVAAYRSGPESIVDRARDAAQWCVASWQAQKSSDSRLLDVDLGQWPARLSDQKLTVLAGICGSIARLHSRAKPSEQRKYQSRPLVEDDAEFALASVGMLLREIGWAV